MEPITINAFMGANLALDSILLPEGVGVVSLNQRPGYGDLRPWNAPSAAVATVPTSPQRKTIWRMGQDVATDAEYWLSWSGVVHAVSGFLADDPTEQTYFTGDGSPKWTDNIKALTGGPPYPQATRELAVPAPTTALTAAVNTSPGTGTDQAFSWIYTWVNDLGWESAPSPVSNTLLGKPGTTFDLSGFDTVPGGNYGITLLRLYRFVPGATDGGDYFFLREWAVGSPPSNPIDDARAVGTDGVPSEGWRVPPADGKGLTKLWNGMLLMGAGKAVRLCVPYKPYAWPLAYELPLSHAFVAAGVFGQRVLVLTTGDAKVFVGSSPDAMDEEPTKLNRPCSSPRSVVDFNEGSDRKGVVWASEEGLCWYGEGGFRLLTDKILDADQWQALVPSTMVASRVDQLYICFYNDGANKGFVIDPQNPAGIYFLATGYDATYRDPLTDRLYVLDGGNVRRWDTGSALTATFRSKLIRVPAPVNIGVLQVISKVYPVTVTMWGDGVQRYTGSIPSDDPIKPPSGWRADELQFEVSAPGRVIALRAARRVEELRRP